MKHVAFVVLGLAAGWPAGVGAAEAAAESREEQSFDGGWRFHRGDAPGAERAAFDDSEWRELDLPHDWSIEGPYDENAATGGPGGYLPAGIGWYRKTFTLPAGARGRKVSIRFDGVYMNSTVWINGHELGTWPYGYTTFHYDLTPHLAFGGEPNVVAVRVDNSRQPGSRWYSGSGIYRHTWLTLTAPVHVGTWGTHVTTPEVSPARATVRVRTRVRNELAAGRRVNLVSEILAPDGRVVATMRAGQEAPGGGTVEFDQETALAQPQLWSPASPLRYRLRSVVELDGRAVDEYFTDFGVRRIEFDRDRGLLLNGRKVILRGMCLHHDGGAVGAAVPEAVLERRLRLLQEMGCNAVRGSHNPMAPEFYDLCDRLGLLVMDEAFDEWTVRKPQIRFGYSDYFAEWHERDLVNLLHRDRNHPSIVMWSAGNEIGEQWDPRGPDILRELVAIIHREDPTRPVTVAMDNIFNERGPAPVAFAGLLDVVGYNYVDRWGTRRETHYADDRVLFPGRRFVGTENASARGTRAEYRFGPLAGRDSGPAGALYLTDALRAESLWKFVATHEYVIGDFAWTGIDYLGEARWPRKAATSGPLDTCGFRKDSFYFYQSIWTTDPMVHLLPHWNWPERAGQVVPVVAYTNCDVVELFLNGRSLGAKAKEFPRQGAAGGWNTYARPQVQASTADLHLVWDVVYEPGELRAVGWKDGRVVAEDVVQTAGPAVALEVTVDRAEIAADARDVAHCTVRALDARGVFVPLATNRVTFALRGPGQLLAVDNGDPADHESYQGDARALFGGMALGLVQSRREAGSIQVTVSAEGLRSATVSVTSRFAR